VDVISNKKSQRWKQEVDAIEAGSVETVHVGTPLGDFSMVVIRGRDGYLTIYGHVVPEVSQDQSISVGQRIGRTDCSGNTDYSHVHIVRVKASEQLPNRENWDDLLERIADKPAGGGQGDPVDVMNCPYVGNVPRESRLRPVTDYARSA
jgi:murein DD-endopeptidase MepM/ murein hydrolase activator NlpD